MVADEVKVAAHARLPVRSQIAYDWQHYLPLIERKPAALRNGAPFADLAGFDFTAVQVDEELVGQLAGKAFVEAVHNVVLIGGTGIGKSHLATALSVASITQHGKRVRFYSTVDLVNLLER